LLGHAGLHDLPAVRELADVRALPRLHHGHGQRHVFGLPELRHLQLLRERARLQQLRWLRGDVELHGLPDRLLQLPHAADLHGAVWLRLECDQRQLLRNGGDLLDLRGASNLRRAERLLVDERLRRYVVGLFDLPRSDDVRDAARLLVVGGQHALHGDAHAVRDADRGNLLDPDGLRAAIAPASAGPPKIAARIER
jgi:hypothetical protein